MAYCQYAADNCSFPEGFKDPFEGFFIYPSEPTHLSNTVVQAVENLRAYSSPNAWHTWQDYYSGGQIILCEICKAMRSARTIIADITTLNFNVLFELGFALGLRRMVLPVRDESYEGQRKRFEELGFLDTLLYKGFANSKDLASVVMREKVRAHSPLIPAVAANRQQPIFYVRSPVDSDASVRLFSLLKKGYFRFRTFDCRETSRLSLHEAQTQVFSSLAVVAHLIDPNRREAAIHNARAAFVCGLAVAAGKHVLMLQETYVPQPIDYRDLVIPYSEVNEIHQHVESLFKAVAETFQTVSSIDQPVPKGLLERIDLGDLAAENEIRSLSRYFVKTPQFQQAVQGHARLVVGRKGAGKSALFYAIRSEIMAQKNILVLDLKPEGHQLVKLREVLTPQLTEGLALHTLAAFWTYLLYLEIAYKLLSENRRDAYRSPQSLKSFLAFQKEYETRAGKTEGDFSERLMVFVERLASSLRTLKGRKPTSEEITAMTFQDDIPHLRATIIENLGQKDNIGLLVDNLDKGWPAHGAVSEDIMILRSLLEGTRKIQRSLEANRIEVASIIFIRKDIHELLIDQTPDRGKDTAVNLDWSDVELLKSLLLRRLTTAPGISGNFENAWATLFNPHVGGQDSFRYMLDRTFLRPRDLLNFVRKGIQIAVSRQHERVEDNDIKTAESAFSDDMFNDLRYEIRDVLSEFPQVLDAFVGEKAPALSNDEVTLLLWNRHVPNGREAYVLDMLLWFCFLGVKIGEEECYAYQDFYNLAKLKARVQEIPNTAPIYVIHPAFRSAISL